MPDLHPSCYRSLRVPYLRSIVLQKLHCFLVSQEQGQPVPQPLRSARQQHQTHLQQIPGTDLQKSRHSVQQPQMQQGPQISGPGQTRIHLPDDSVLEFRQLLETRKQVNQGSQAMLFLSLFHSP